MIFNGLLMYNEIRFNQDLKLPSLPEMVFPESSLKIEHASGVTLEFLAMDALQLVNTSEYPLKVAMADEWSKQRLGNACYTINMVRG